MDAQTVGARGVRGRLVGCQDGGAMGGGEGLGILVGVQLDGVARRVPGGPGRGRAR
jgi:hypothetical protein